jgi:RNA polymerase sigma factor (sigma-70 family)
MLNENQILEACIQENRAAQRQLYEGYAPKLFALAIRYMKNRDDAQDVLQDAFVKIFKNLQNFRNECPLEGWLKRIVVNTALKALQKNKQMHLVDIGDWSEDANVVTTVNLGLENLSMAALNNLIDQLPDGCRTIFNLYAIEGYKHHEIADLLSIAEGTSKSQFSRARQILMDKMKYQNHIVA